MADFSRTGVLWESGMDEGCGVGVGILIDYLGGVMVYGAAFVGDGDWDWDALICVALVDRRSS